MNRNYLAALFFLCNWALHAQTQSLKNFIEIDHEEHTRIVTSRPGQVFIENAQNIVIDLSGATGFNKKSSEPHIGAARALAHIKNGQVQSPQLRVYNTPRDYFRCNANVYPVDSFKEESFVQIRSACNEVYFDRFFLRHASSSVLPNPQQKIHLNGTNVLHSKILQHGNEAYALLVETPELKANGEVNEGGLGSDTVVLARLNFIDESYDTITFFKLPASQYKDFRYFFGQAKISSDFQEVFLKSQDTLYTFNLNSLEPDIKLVNPNSYFGVENRTFFRHFGFSGDSLYYNSIYQINYRFNQANPIYDSVRIDLPNRKFSSDNSLMIFPLDSSHLIYSEARYLDNKRSHLGITLADKRGKIIWQKQIAPDYLGLILSDVQYINDTIVFSGYYEPGRFVLNRETSKVEFFPNGNEKSICFRVLMDGTNLDAEELSKSEELVVFPNPFIVDFKIAEQGITKYQIVNLNGDLVAEEKLDPSIGVYRIYQPMLDYGLYILRLYKEDGERLEKKIFKLNSGF